MIEVLLAAISIGLLLILAGLFSSNRFLPFEAGDSPMDSLLDALAVLVVSTLLLALVGARVGLLGRPLLAVIGLAVIVTASPAKAGRSPMSALPAAGIAALSAVGLWLRRDPIYFLGDWADFGEYVNRGNGIALGRPPGGFFPPLTETYVAVGHLLFSSRYAMTIVPLLALVTGYYVAAVTFRLTRSVAAAWVAGGLFALHPVAVWFGRLPTSEAGFGLLSMILVYQLMRSAEDGSRWPVALTTAALVLSRPNGLVSLLPFAAIIVTAGFSATERNTWSRAVWPFCLGWMLGFAWLWKFGLLDATLATFAGEYGPRVGQAVAQVQQLSGLIIIGGFLVAFGLGLRFLCSNLPSVAWAPAALLLGGVLVSALAVLAAGRLSILAEGVSSMGLATVGLALAGGAALTLRNQSAAGTVAVVAPAVLWATSYSFQFDEALPHYIYLYWERYLFPNVFLTLFVLAGASAQWFVLLGKRLSVTPWLERTTMLVPVLLAVGFIPSYRLQHARQYHGEDFYEVLEALADELPNDAVVEYIGVRADLIWERYFFFFPNTYRVIAHPLRDTFGVEFSNLPTEPTGPDPVGPSGLSAATHRIEISLEPVNDRDLRLGETQFPLSLLPRNSESIDDWNEWEVVATVQRLTVAESP